MSDFSERRRIMVDTQVRPSDVTSYPIINAMLRVPREIFVPDTSRDLAYMGEHIFFDNNKRVILDSRTLAKMLECIHFVGTELVLDVGGGYGYSSAIAASNSQAVVLLESVEECIAEAPVLLSDIGVDNVVIQEGDLSRGAPELGPYDAMLIQGGVGVLPEALTDQLKEGGRIVALFMENGLGSVRLGYKILGDVTWRYAFNATAPILEGFERKREFTL